MEGGVEAADVEDSDGLHVSQDRVAEVVDGVHKDFDINPFLLGCLDQREGAVHVIVRVADESVGGFGADVIPGPSVENYGFTPSRHLGGAKHVRGEFKYFVPERLFYFITLRQMTHSLYTATSEPALVRGGIWVPVTDIYASVELFAPLFIFSRVGQGCAERWPYFGKGDRVVIETFAPRFLAVGARGGEIAVHEVSCESSDGEVREGGDFTTSVSQ